MNESRTSRLQMRLWHVLNALDPRPKTRHFIHIPKNGGRAVRLALTLKKVALELPLHTRYVDLEPNGSRRYFCVVRNPWSRTASRFLHTKNNALEWPVDDPRRRYIERVSFEEYVRERRVFSIPGSPDRLWPLSLWIDQVDWITDRTGHVVGDCLRLEALDEELSTYLGRRIRVGRSDATRSRPYDYRAMYSERTIQLVADAFVRDIKHFGFDFEGAATRNTYTTP